MSTLVSQKKDLRKILTKKRDIIKKNATVEFNYNVFKQLKKFIDFEKINDVASFASIRSEISTTQTPSWSSIDDSQSPSWSEVNDSQTPNWQEVA